MYQAYRCEVCGEVYLGSEKPDECPFCGAHKQFLKAVDMEEVELLRVDNISDRSMENIRAAMDLEVDNASFYFTAASEVENEDISETFERLGKVEEEHASALAKLGDIERKDLPDVEVSSDPIENFEKSHRREERAINAYSNFVSEAPESEVEKFFEALVDIEGDHLTFSQRKIEEE